MRFFVTMLLLVVPLCAQDAAPPRKGGGGPPKNLKVLTPDDLKSGIMGKFAAAMGQRCGFCHVQGDFASDEKPQKNIARMMITMVKDINSKITVASGGTAKEYVSCYTCHRGKPEPDIAPPAAQ
ncbi:MAG TPA: c-type cytochrome [Bryobacteraceae bacterium]|nr:c-type cytochrome [Bryobacteraceae bacterium]